MSQVTCAHSRLFLCLEIFNCFNHGQGRKHCHVQGPSQFQDMETGGEAKPDRRNASNSLQIRSKVHKNRTFAHPEKRLCTGFWTSSVLETESPHSQIPQRRRRLRTHQNSHQNQGGLGQVSHKDNTSSCRWLGSRA